MKESIAEMDEMEALRLEAELEKQRLSVASTNTPSSNGHISNNNNSKSSNDLHMVNRENRDSGITGDTLSTGGSHDQLMLHSAHGSTNSNRSSGLTNTNRHQQSNGAVVLRKSAINNSLLDLTDASEKMTRRGSVGSLDSGMSISFVQSGATPTTESAQMQRHSSDGQQKPSVPHQQQQFSGSRLISNGKDTTHPILGTCNNCMNPISALPLQVSSNNHTSACYHHMHHHHYHHHHHNLHLQPEYQHRHPNNTPGGNGTVSSRAGNNSTHNNNTVASITSALL